MSNLNLYSAFLEKTSNAVNTDTSTAKMSSATVRNCPQNTPDAACPHAESSRQPGQQQKTPDVRRY